MLMIISSTVCSKLSVAVMAHCKKKVYQMNDKWEKDKQEKGTEVEAKLQESLEVSSNLVYLEIIQNYL